MEDTYISPNHCKKCMKTKLNVPLEDLQFGHCGGKNDRTL